MMNTKTKILIGGAAVLAIGATTYMVVKKAKEKKAKLSSSNKDTDVIPEEINEEVKEFSETNVVNKTTEEKNKEVSEDKVEKKEENVKVEEKEEEVEKKEEESKSDEKSKPDKKKGHVEQYCINLYDDEGKERKSDEKLTDEDEIATIKEYAVEIKKIKSSEDIKKFVEENSTFEKFKAYNSELLELYKNEVMDEELAASIKEDYEYVKENIISTNCENYVTVFNNIRTLYTKLNKNEDIFYDYCPRLISDIKNALFKLAEITRSVLAEEELEEAAEEMEDEIIRYENEEDIIDSVLRDRYDYDEDELVNRPVFGNMGLNINNGHDEELEDSYEEEDYLNDAKKDFLINTKFEYED